MSYWFVPVVLGFRILGLGELVRIPLWARSEGRPQSSSSASRSTGFIGLFVRISAELLPGVLGYNNGVWLAVVAKVPMWLLVLGAIQRWPLGRGSRIALPRCSSRSSRCAARGRSWRSKCARPRWQRRRTC